MPKFYCDYCDIYLTHDSANVRKTHGSGWKHKSAVRNYYEQVVADMTDAERAEYLKNAPPTPMGMPGMPGMPPFFRGPPPPFFRGPPGMPPGFNAPFRGPAPPMMGLPPGMAAAWSSVTSLCAPNKSTKSK
eukprot:CAMPEP_0168593524 /NCGR_PEP_ID=MMETSP0420-20121227/8365_1 /TAXON_ID=498008 /ORGANISM="Pessonella sp." /LENGTH=130 /DNA_ID=CAMNT_0008629691 /DNA_START=49 /DNA_END=440 /DNA_ORIENTATION=+